MTSYQNNNDHDTEMIELLDGEMDYRTVLVQEVAGFTSARLNPADNLYRVSVTLLTATKEKTLVIAKFQDKDQADMYYDRLKTVTNTISTRTWMNGVGREASPVTHTELVVK